ncbi:MAG: hypothetical protein ABW352_13105 [Polyangiales bacterium]
MKRCLLLLSTLLFACTEGGAVNDDATLTLSITSNLRVPQELDRVTVRVAGQDTAIDPEADLREHPLPRTLTLVHESGPLGPFAVSVRGYFGSSLVVQRDLTASFPSSGNTDLTVDLDRSCRNIACVQGETCESGRCVIIGGVEDAGFDAARPDASHDAGQDANDATLDAQVQDAASDANADADADADAGEQPDAAGEDAGSDASSAQPPTCTITLPVTGDVYQTGALFPLRGSCTDPETGALSALTWLSSQDGLLGSGAELEGRLSSASAQRISLCAPDPRDPMVVGCASVDVTATTTPQPAVGIASITQGNLVASPYSASAPLSFAGVGTGAGVTLSWSDDVQGPLGSASSATLATPFVGRHTVTFSVLDRNGVQRTATQSYLVLGAGESTLVSPLANVNSELDRAGDLPVATIASDGQSRAYVPSSSGVWYRFDGNQLTSNATAAVGQPPLRDVVQDAQISGNNSYLATRDGLTVCNYNPGNGAGEPCMNFRAGGLLQSQNFLSVLRMVDSRNVDTLLVGSDNGLFLSESVNGSARGSVILRPRVVNDMVALNGQAALALDNGLTLLLPSTQQQVRFTTAEGLPSNNLRSLAVAPDNTLWIASAGGLAHYEPGSNRITSWTTTRGLPSNNCTGVAVQRVTQLSPARDIVWVSTAAGIARLDTLNSTVTTYSTVDGLPSNNALAVHVLANGTKLFGTQNGLARYVGF